MTAPFSVDREAEVEKNYLVTLFNKYFEKEDYKINYGYYINEVKKISDPIDGKR